MRLDFIQRLVVEMVFSNNGKQNFFSNDMNETVIREMFSVDVKVLTCCVILFKGDCLFCDCFS